MDYSKCIKIGSNHVFDKHTGVIYEVQRDGEEVTGFKEAYTVTIGDSDKAVVSAKVGANKIPAGVVNKAIYVLRHNEQ